jgi:methyl-accepting chemotaxis protein
MADENLDANVVISGDAKGAKKAVKETEKGFKRLTSGIKKFSLAQAAAVTGVVLAIKKMVSSVGTAVDAANAQEDSVKRLEVATSKLGAAGDATAKSVQDYATQLQKVSTIGDEAAISTAAFLLQMGVAPGQINEAVQASADLAASLGIDLQSAARNVGKTVGGFAGELGEVIPELKDLSKEALQSGEAITLLGNKFKGAAAKEAETFSGKIQQLKNAFGDMQEEIGFGITKNQEMIDSIDKMKGNIEGLTPEVAELSENLVTLAVSAANATVELGRVIGDFILQLEGSDIASTMEDGAIATGVLRTRAMELGITVEELQLRLKASVNENKRLNAAARETAESLETEAQAAERAAAAQKKLDQETRDAATALEKLGDALGIVTSAHLETEILKIDEALEAVRITSGEFSQEYQYAAEVARDKTDELRLRIESLRSGMGDVADEVDTVSESVETFADAVVSASGSVVSLNSSLTQNMAFLRNTAVAYDLLARSIGEATARQLALESGLAKLSQGGTRIRFAGGGSRLTGSDSTYSGTSSYALSQFGSGGKAKVNPDGSLRPV